MFCEWSIILSQAKCKYISVERSGFCSFLDMQVQPYNLLTMNAGSQIYLKSQTSISDPAVFFKKCGWKKKMYLNGQDSAWFSGEQKGLHPSSLLRS